MWIFDVKLKELVDFVIYYLEVVIVVKLFLENKLEIFLFGGSVVSVK